MKQPILTIAALTLLISACVTEKAAQTTQTRAPAAASKPPVAASSRSNLPNLKEGAALAQRSGCFACHDKEFKRQIIGPPWGAVAEKYRGRPEARAILIKWVHTGGTGRWGKAVMPPYSPRVPDAEIEELVDFILSLPSPS